MTKLVDPQVVTIAPDGSSLLAFVGEPTGTGVSPLWRIPLPSGEPRRLGNIEAQGVNLLPDGRVLFTNDTGLFVAHADGSDVRKLLTGADEVTCPRASPNGKRIVVRIWNPAHPGSTSVFLEAASDGSHLQEIMRAPEDAGLGCPYWTPDGKYLIYRVIRGGRFDVWAVAVDSWFSKRYSQKTQLTNGPLSYDIAVPSRDGKEIFAIGTKRRGELVRYDEKTKQFIPFLGGMSAIEPTFSRDGKWMAYTSYPDHTLWRSRTDGTDRRQLTYPPMQVSWPVISQDGKQVSFRTNRSELYVIDMNGESLRKIVDNSPAPANFSPDGNVLVRTVEIPDKSAGEKNSWELQTIDLRNGATSMVPSSKGMIGAFWPMQDTLVAANEDSTKLFTFSFRSGKWVEVASGAIVNWMSSPDGTYFYYTTGGSDPKAMRLRLTDRKIEEIASLKDLKRVVDSVDAQTQISVAPDGSPVFTRDIGTQEIYSLIVKWP